MGPHDISFGESAYSFLLEATRWLNPLVYICGLAIALWAFRRCRKGGYLVVAVYFAWCVFFLLAMPSINRAIRAHSKADASEQSEPKAGGTQPEAANQVPKPTRYPAIVSKGHYNFPLGPMILVAGLWFIAKREPPLANKV